MHDPSPTASEALLHTGVAGLDEVLQGGLARNRLYLVEGMPGSGKTTLALQFLLEGVRGGEPGMFVSLSESREELEATAAAHGWRLDGIHVVEIVPSEEMLRSDAAYTMYHPSEVELGETTRRLLDEAARAQPARLVVDSLSELRLLAENSLRYRRQILALKQHFAARRCTVLFIDDRTGSERDVHLHSLAHGVVSLEREDVEYGATRRRMHVGKMRGRAFREGYHDFSLRTGGIEVFPRLVAAEHRTPHPQQDLSSGLPALDAMLGGGLSRGTSTLVLGPAGCGKSWLASQFVDAASARGERALVFLFDESLVTWKRRMRTVHGRGGEPGEASLAGIQVHQVDPAEMSPGEFAHRVRAAVERDGASVVVIDSLNGFINAMPSARFLMLHLHELLAYLGQKGVTTIMLLAQHGFLGRPDSPVDASYLADTVLLLRYFETAGELRKAISVVKKRTGRHSTAIHAVTFDRGLEVGAPIANLQGVLLGSPQPLP